MSDYDTYKGFRLRLRLDSSPHGVECQELDFFDETLSGIKSKINAHLKANKAEKAPAVPALKVRDDASFGRVNITSLDGFNEAWVTEGGWRYKCTTRVLYADTPENEAALIDLEEKIKAAQASLKEQVDLIALLPKPTILQKPAP